MLLSSQRFYVLFAGFFSQLLCLGIARFAYTPLLPIMQQQTLPYSGIGTLRFAFEEQAAGGYYVQADAYIDGQPKPLTTLLSGEVERVSVGSNKDDIILQVNGLGNHALLDTNQLAFGGNS